MDASVSGKTADKPNLTVIDYQVKLNVALLPLSDHFSWSLHFPPLLLFFCPAQIQLFTPCYLKPLQYLVQGDFNSW